MLINDEYDDFLEAQNASNDIYAVLLGESDHCMKRGISALEREPTFDSLDNFLSVCSLTPLNIDREAGET